VGHQADRRSPARRLDTPRASCAKGAPVPQARACFAYAFNQSYTVAPLFYRRSGATDSSTIAFPLYWRFWSQERSTTVVFPFYFGVRRPTWEGTFIFPSIWWKPRPGPRGRNLPTSGSCRSGSRRSSGRATICGRLSWAYWGGNALAATGTSRCCSSHSSWSQ